MEINLIDPTCMSIGKPGPESGLQWAFINTGKDLPLPWRLPINWANITTISISANTLDNADRYLFNCTDCVETLGGCK
jgi:hypothetical protein